MSFVVDVFLSMSTAVRRRCGVSSCRDKLGYQGVSQSLDSTVEPAQEIAAGQASVGCCVDLRVAQFFSNVKLTTSVVGYPRECFLVSLTHSLSKWISAITAHCKSNDRPTSRETAKVTQRAAADHQTFLSNVGRVFLCVSVSGRMPFTLRHAPRAEFT